LPALTPKTSLRTLKPLADEYSCQGTTVASRGCSFRLPRQRRVPGTDDRPVAGNAAIMIRWCPLGGPMKMCRHLTAGLAIHMKKTKVLPMNWRNLIT